MASPDYAAEQVLSFFVFLVWLRGRFLPTGLRVAIDSFFVFLPVLLTPVGKMSGGVGGGCGGDDGGHRVTDCVETVVCCICMDAEAQRDKCPVEGRRCPGGAICVQCEASLRARGVSDCPCCRRLLVQVAVAWGNLGSADPWSRFKPSN
jgi:hypothetical protein